MTTTNGDLLYTEVLKKDKINSLRDLSRLRIQIKMSCFLLHHRVSLVLVYFQYMY